MKVPFDTHALLWVVTDHPSLPDRPPFVLLDVDNDVLVSAVTGFEIGVKYSLGKLKLTEPPRDFMENRIRHNALSPMASNDCGEGGTKYSSLAPYGLTRLGAAKKDAGYVACSADPLTPIHWKSGT